MNLNTKIKAKATKNSKSKKKNNSYNKIPECKPTNQSHQRSPITNYELKNKPSISSKMVGLSNVNFHNSGVNMLPKRKQSASYKHSDSSPHLSQKHGSRERTGLSQERIQKRENGKHQIVNFIGKYIKKNSEIEIDQNYEETLKNLKDFLGYLEDKNIINGQQLEDKKEVNNLIKDLMKLDLSKFNSLKKESMLNSK